MQTKRWLGAAVAVVCAVSAVGTAHAQFEAISQGLFLAGFRIDAQKNPLTKGVEFTTSQSFFPGNNTLSYGISKLTIDSGALTIQGSYGRRPFPGFSIGLSSAPGPGVAPQPISYTLSIPRAAESITVTGTATINTSFQADATGYYHEVLNIDNRGTVKTTGLVNSTKNIDFTLGPIDQTGNIFVQGLQGLLGNNSTTTASSLASALDASGSSKLTEADMQSLDLNDPEQLKAYVNAALVDGITQAALDPSLGEGGNQMIMVPEPATFALLLLSGSLCVAGFRRHRA